MKTRPHILIVDATLGAPPWLAAIGHGAAGAPPVVLHAASAAEADALVTARAPRIDAMVISADLPDAPGATLCERLRARGQRLPIILIGRDDREEEAVRGLDAGANDYLARPVRAAELAARLRAQLRAVTIGEEAELPVGPYVFHPGSRQLVECASQRRIRLTEKETAVLKHLWRAGGSPVGRKALLRDVWGYSPLASTHTVETHIYRLRRKVEPDAARITLLVNEDGGYRLNTDWQPDTVQAWVPGAIASENTAAYLS